MPILSDTALDAVWADWMEANTEPVGITKQAVRTAVGEMDAWIEAQLPLALTSMTGDSLAGLSNTQKFNLFFCIVRARVA